MKLSSKKLTFWRTWICHLELDHENESESHSVFDPRDYTVHGILQATILEWVAFPFSRGSSQPRERTQVSCIVGRFFTNWATRTWQYLKYFCEEMGGDMNKSDFFLFLAARILFIEYCLLNTVYWILFITIWKLCLNQWVRVFQKTNAGCQELVQEGKCI